MLTVAVGLASPAYATGPAWEPDPNTALPYGNVVFYDAAGNRVTSGTDLSSPFAYAVATTPNPTGSTGASDYVAFYSPDHTEPTSSWSGIQVTGTTNFDRSSLPKDTPQDLVDYAPQFPVASTPGPTITSWLGGIGGLDGADGYANTIQVRLYLQSTTSGYWSTDIGYNTSSTPISVDGTTVPANGWAVLYPAISANSSISLSASSSSGQVTTRDPLSLTATVNIPVGSSGGVVQLYDGGTFLADVAVSGRAAAYTYTPALGTHTYTASYIPDPSQPELAGSASKAVTMTVSPIQTTTSVAAGSTNLTVDQPNTFIASITAADDSQRGVEGSVQFYDGTNPLGTPVASVVTGGGTGNSPGVGTAQLTMTLPLGNHSITASFKPVDTTYSPSTSSPVGVELLAATGCGSRGSGCSDSTASRVVPATINPGSIAISTSYTPTNPLVLPDMMLSADGTFLESSPSSSAGAGSLHLTVTSSLVPAYPWTLSVAATPFTSPRGDVIPASGVGVTGGQLLNTSRSGAYPGTVTFNDIPPLNPSPEDGPGTGPGLGSTPQIFAKSSAADGSAEIGVTIMLYAATTTPAGNYSGTISFAVS